MIIKVETARHYLARDGVQVSTEAAAMLAMELDRHGRRLTERAMAILDAENRARGAQGLRPRTRLTADDIERASGPQDI